MNINIIYIYACLVLFAISSSKNAYAQIDTKNNTTITEAHVIDGDTLANVLIGEIPIFYHKEFDNWWEKRKYTRLIYNVKKAYPFAIIARTELKRLNDSLELISEKRARKKFIARYEKEMFNEYDTDLKKLTFTQGRIMLKLVDREIGNTPYLLIQEYRGNVSAAFWQGIARIFGTNLKTPYDPKGEDQEIEEIILMIEAGLI